MRNPIQIVQVVVLAVAIALSNALPCAAVRAAPDTKSSTSPQQVQVSAQDLGDAADMIEQDLLRACRNVAVSHKSTMPVRVEVRWLNRAEFIYGIDVWVGEHEDERPADASTSCEQCVHGDITRRAADLVDELLTAHEPKPVPVPSEVAPPLAVTPVPEAKAATKSSKLKAQEKLGLVFMGVGGAMAISGGAVALTAKPGGTLRPVAQTTAMVGGTALLFDGAALLAESLRRERRVRSGKSPLGADGALAVGTLAGGAALGLTGIGLMGANGFGPLDTELGEASLVAVSAAATLVAIGGALLVLTLRMRRTRGKMGPVDEMSITPLLTPAFAGAGGRFKF